MSLSEGPKFPTAAADLGGGFIAWANPNNILADDGLVATASLLDTGGEDSTQLLGKGFNFNIPSNATIVGIIAEFVGRKSGTAIVTDEFVMLAKNNVPVGLSRASSVFWPSTLTFRSYGSPTDLWGTTWTPADINGAGFGLMVQAINNSTVFTTASIDVYRITVYYESVRFMPVAVIIPG